MDTPDITAALFPIPNMVAFPGTVVPLHVFEPRYRQMITDCVEQDRMIGVCHTRKEIRAAKKEQSVRDALHSNQATYDPHPVFSAGHCQVMETTSDGRLYVNIAMSKRLTLINEVQTLPYRVVTCRELEDESGSHEAGSDTQRQITSRLVTLIGRQNPAGLQQFDADAWMRLEPGEFSFKVFQLLRFDADTMQAILESRSPTERLGIIDTILSQLSDSPGA